MDHTMRVWDGSRPRTPRTFVSTDVERIVGLEFRFVAETVNRPTDWCFQEPHHVFVVHRSGALQSMEIEFNPGPSGHCLPRPADVWVIPAEHQYAALAQGNSVEFCEIIVPATVFGDRYVAPRVGQPDEFLARIVERLADQVGQIGAMPTLLRQSLAETARLHVLDRYTVGRRARPVRRRHLDREAQQLITDYLRTESEEKISLAALADMVEMTPRHFLAAFADVFHTTPYQYVLDQRIARAKQMLINSSASITEISDQIGFSTPSHFATTFKQRVGTTPTAYRSAHGE